MDRDLSLTLTHARGARPLPVRWVALSRRSDRVFTMESDGEDRRIVERDAATFAELTFIDPAVFGEGRCASEFLVSGDGALLVAVLWEKVPFLCVHDRATGRRQRIEIPEPDPPGLRWATDGEIVSLWTRGRTSHLYDVRELASLRVLEGICNASSDDGELIACTSGRRHVLARTRSGEELGRWFVDSTEDRGPLCAVSREPLGLWCVAEVSGADHDVDVWWCEPGRPPSHAGGLRSGDRIVAMRASEGELTLASARGAVVRARPDTRTGRVEFEALHGGRRPGVLGRLLVDSRSSDGVRCSGRVWAVPVQIDLATGDVTTWGDGPGSPVTAIAASSDGRQLGVAWWGGDLAVLDADTLEPRWTFETSDGPVFGCALSPDGRTLHALTADRLRAWDLSTGGEVTGLPIPGPALRYHRGCEVRAFHDGRHLLVGVGHRGPEGLPAWYLVDLDMGAVFAAGGDKAWDATAAAFTSDGSEIVVVESSRDRLGGGLRAVTFDVHEGRGEGLLRERRAPVDLPRQRRLERPALIEDGRALLGAPAASDATSSFLRWDLAENLARHPAIPECDLIAHGEGLGVFSAWRGLPSVEVQLRDLGTLRERASVKLSACDEVRVAALVGDRALVVGLSDGRLMRFAIGRSEGRVGARTPASTTTAAPRTEQRVGSKVTRACRAIG